MACYEKVKCPACETTTIRKAGLTPQGKQRYCCQNAACQKKTFILDYHYNACKPGITKQILSMTINGSGIRDIARVLAISKTTVLDKLKKKQGD
jgi:transposase-like protein